MAVTTSIWVGLGHVTFFTGLTGQKKKRCVLTPLLEIRLNHSLSEGIHMHMSNRLTPNLPVALPHALGNFFHRLAVF